MDQNPGEGAADSGHPDANLPTQVSPSTSSCASSRDISTREVVNCGAELVNGRLDLSDQGLTTLSPAFKVQYLEVHDLDVSRNNLHSLNSKWFPNLTKLDISKNSLSRLSSLCSLQTTLRELVASGNDVTSLDGVQQFLRLERLVFGDNALKTVTVMTTHSLRVLELNGNLLYELPDLSNLCNLEIFDLGHNRIKSLSSVSTHFPKSLKELGIVGNPIVDITELVFLKDLKNLKKIDLYPLPCLSAQETAKFDYHHLLLCLIHDLEYIDGEVVLDVDVICGENLAVKGKVTGSKRQFHPGGGEHHHRFLCDYLASEMALCVENGKSLNGGTPLRKEMLKALKKKEQYDSEGSSRLFSPRQESVSSTNRTTDDDFSAHSPFSNWNRQMDKENADPDTTDASSIPSARSPITRGRRVIETGAGRKLAKRSGSVGSRLCSFASMQISGTSEEEKQMGDEEKEEDQSTLRDDSGPPSTSTTPTPRLQDEDPPKPKPRTTLSSKSAEQLKVLDTTTRYSPLTSSHTIHRTPRTSRVADVTFMRQSERRMSVDEERIRALEGKMGEMAGQIDLLSRTNEQLSLLLEEQQESHKAALEAFQQKIDGLTQEIRLREKPPTPFALGVMKRTENAVEIRWELRHVQEYAVYINGQDSGRVTAPSRIARISDMDSAITHTIQLQAIGLDGSRGELSTPLTISPGGQ